MILTDGRTFIASTRDELRLFGARYEFPEEYFIEDDFRPRYKVPRSFIHKKWGKRSKLFKSVYIFTPRDFREILDVHRFKVGPGIVSEMVKRSAYSINEQEYGNTVPSYTWADVEAEARALRYDPDNTYSFRDLLKYEERKTITKNSNNTMEWKQAYEIAKELKQLIGPHCEEFRAAGSLRRRRPTVKDLELVVVPKMVQDGQIQLLDEVKPRMVPDPGFIASVETLEKIKGTPQGKYTQRKHPGGLVIDLFIANPENFGLILAIRTGSADFCRRVLIPAINSSGHRSIDGHLFKHVQDGPNFSASRIECPDEEFLFDLIGINPNYYEPENRQI